GIAHLPEHVELELQDLERALLRCACREMIQGEGKAKLDVAPREADPALKILQALGVDPAVMLRPVREPLLVNFRGKELGERGADRLRPRRPACEVDIRVHREPPPGNPVVSPRAAPPQNPPPPRQPQPGIDSARIPAV